MQFSPEKLVTFVRPGYCHTGKKDRDDGFCCNNNASSKRTRRQIKKAWRRLIDFLAQEK